MLDDGKMGKTVLMYKGIEEREVLRPVGKYSTVHNSGILKNI